MNYVFFFPDELRAETLACYGHPHIRTPHFDRLASEGVLFSQCHVQNTVCSPSRCSLMTGRYPHVNGHRTLWNLLSADEDNLCRSLKDAGYDVRIFGKNDLFSPEAASRSVSGWLSPGGSGIPLENTCSFGEAGYYDFLYRPLSHDIRQNSDSQAVHAAVSYLKSRTKDSKPFFLFLPLLNPHCPYTIQEPFYSMYAPGKDTLPLRGRGMGKPSFHKLIREYRRLENPQTLEKIQAVYMGMISYVDSLLGELLRTLDETGLAQDTMVIASSDHGDYAGDYGLTEKWPSGFEDILTRVPLIVRMPGCAAGYRVTEPVELFDISATILETAELPALYGSFAKSFVPQLSGASGDKNRAVFCEGGYNSSEEHCNEGEIKPGTSFMQTPETIYYPKGLQQLDHPESVCRGVMIRTNQYKLIRRSNGEHELYSLQDDPLELHNVYGCAKYRQDQEKLEQRLLQWYLDTSDVVKPHEDSRSFPEGDEL